MSDLEPKTEGGDYQYKGIPLTPTIAQILIRKLFTGKLVERRILADEVMRVHLAGGGLKASAQDVMSVFKRALGDMKESGSAENTSVGYWRIHHLEVAGDNSLAVPAESFPTFETPASELNVGPEPAADVELGTGSSAILRLLLADVQAASARTRREIMAVQDWPHGPQSSFTRVVSSCNRTA